MIEHYFFGKFVIDGKTYESNVRLVGGRAEPARYLPGHELLLSDITPLIDAKPDYLIIGTGASGVIEVSERIRRVVAEKGIELIVLPTAQACRRYNELLKQNKRIAAFLHNTC